MFSTTPPPTPAEIEANIAERIACATSELIAENRRLAREISLNARRESSLQQIADQYRSMFDNATDGMFQTTADGSYLDCNPALARIYGYESADELKNSVADIKRQLYVENDARPRFVTIMREYGRVSGFEARVYRKDGSIIWISETAREVRDTQGNFLYYEGFVSDITARKLAEEALRESRQRYELAVCGANDGIWDWDLKTGYIYFSDRWREMLACDQDPITPNADLPSLPELWFNRVHPDDLENLTTAIAAHRDGLTSHFAIEHRMMHRDGTYRWMLCRGIAVHDQSGKAIRMAGSLSDITDRKHAEEQLLRDALHDGLTGLPNRVLFNDRLERSIARVTRDPNHHYAVLFIDLDRFKRVNDSLGHVVGDELLLGFAKRLIACLRPSDTVARLGGDEFTILLEDPKAPDDAVSVAERILAILKSPFDLGAHEVFASASIGIAVSSTGYTRPQDVLRDADTAMYRAKSLGKSRHQLFDTAMHAAAVKLLQIENDLRRAIDRHELRLHYQPIVRIDTRRICAFEALIRWQHPERGLVSPADFIPIAEETGLIVPIGKWVLHEACRQAASWHAMFPENPIDVNVNLSARQFSQPDLVEQVTTTLRQSGLPPQHLILEITESVVMEHPEKTIEMLNRLKALGIKLNIDDFGTGYSSLAYLQRFPVDAMKIDRSFVARMTESAENAEIVRTIVSLAHNLNIKVTAEGIETDEQWACLADLDCEHGQGYLLSRPVDGPSATIILHGVDIHTKAAA